MGKRVCMLLSYLPFLDARIFELEAKSLAKHGYEVTIIAPRQNGFLQDIDGKPFTRQFRNKSFKYQGIKIITYDCKRKSNHPRTHPLFQLGLRERADIYHAHELSSFYYGKEIKLALKKQNVKNVKLIYDSRQVTPDPFSQSMKEIEKRQSKKILLDSLKEADYTITVSDSIKAWYLSMDPLLPVEVIYNAPPLSSDFKVKGGNPNRLVAAHEGNVSDKNLHTIYTITDSCRKVMDFHFKLIGGPRYGEKISVPDHLQSRIIQSGWIQYESLSSLYSDVDIGLIELDPTSSLNHAFAMPGKLFNYLNNGVPVIVSKCSDMEKFVNTYQCGIVINRLNPTAADYVKGMVYLNKNRSMLRRMSINARKAMEEVYSWEHMEKRLINLYKSLDTDQRPYLLS
ncbi:glycosyltransferase family 4 protein [Salinibacillus aidingensis]|uniref:Glycosyltransferase family 4 protein n=1 Tax=Salinibacillus aidingensis TaxID=237684 RepID=A0ABN1B4J8_9BACI